MNDSYTCNAVFADVYKNIIFFYLANFCAFYIETTLFSYKSALLPVLINIYRQGQA